MQPREGAKGQRARRGKERRRRQRDRLVMLRKRTMMKSGAN